MTGQLAQGPATTRRPEEVAPGGTGIDGRLRGDPASDLLRLPWSWPLPPGSLPSTSRIFLDKLILLVFPQVAGCAGWPGAYDLTARGPSLESEDLIEFLLLAAELGGHAAGPGPSAGGGVDQDGLADGGELSGQLAHRQARAGPGALAPHQAGELQGEDA